MPSESSPFFAVVRSASHAEVKLLRPQRQAFEKSCRMDSTLFCTTVAPLQNTKAPASPEGTRVRIWKCRWIASWNL